MCVCVRSVSCMCVCVFVGGEGGGQNRRVFVWKGVNVEKHGLYSSIVCVCGRGWVEGGWTKSSCGRGLTWKSIKAWSL